MGREKLGHGYIANIKRHLDSDSVERNDGWDQEVNLGFIIEQVHHSKGETKHKWKSVAIGNWELFDNKSWAKERNYVWHGKTSRVDVDASGESFEVECDHVEVERGDEPDQTRAHQISS